MDVGYLRIKQIIGDRRANPPIPAIIPVSATTWWVGVRAGRYPPGYRLGPGVTGWKVSDIKALVDKLGVVPVGARPPRRRRKQDVLTESRQVEQATTATATAKAEESPDEPPGTSTEDLDAAVRRLRARRASR